MTSPTQPDPAGSPVLVCPECIKAHPNTSARIGNRKTGCRTCNRFAQAVRRHVARALAAAHPREAERLRLDAEVHAYGKVVGSGPVGSTDTRGQQTSWRG